MNYGTKAIHAKIAEAYYNSYQKATEPYNRINGCPVVDLTLSLTFDGAPNIVITKYPPQDGYEIAVHDLSMNTISHADSLVDTYRIFANGTVLRRAEIGEEGEPDPIVIFERATLPKDLTFISDLHQLFFNHRPTGLSVSEIESMPEGESNGFRFDLYRMGVEVDNEWTVMFASTEPNELILVNKVNGRRFEIDTTFARLDRDDPLIKGE